MFGADKIGVDEMGRLLDSGNFGDYVTVAGVTSTVDIPLDAAGAIGQKLYGLTVFNNSGSAFSACTLKDGTTVLDCLTLGMTTLASGSYATWTPPGGVLKAKNAGGFSLNITCAGTMANIKIGATLRA